MSTRTKGFTALTVVSLIESGEFGFNTPVRSVIGDVLPLVDQGVTIEHLLGHTPIAEYNELISAMVRRDS